MPSGLRMSMVVVVPTLSEGKHRNPEAVLRSVSGQESLLAPHMGGRVYQPGHMQANYGTEENSPEHKGPSAYEQQDYTGKSDRHPVPTTDESVEFVFAQIGNIRKEFLSVIVHH